MKKKQYAKLLHLGIGVHSFGNATTMLAKPGRITLEMGDHGVLITHLEFKKKAFVPFSNIKAIEFPFDSTYMQDEDESESILPQQTEIQKEIEKLTAENLKMKSKASSKHV